MNKANQSNGGFVDAQKSTNQENMTEAQRRQHCRELRKTWEENNSPAKKAEEAEARKVRFMSNNRVKDIISFVTTGEMKDDSIGKDEETELSDVLQNVLDDFSEDEQNYIFQTLLEETTVDTKNYVTAFLEAKIEDNEEIPYDTARYLAIECESQVATDYLVPYSFKDYDDDPILTLHLMKEMYDGDEYRGEYDRNLREFLVECQDPDEMEFLEDNFDVELQYPYETAVAYYNNADFVKALDCLIHGEDGMYGFEYMNGSEGRGSHFLINILDGIKEDHPQDFANLHKIF